MTQKERYDKICKLVDITNEIKDKLWNIVSFTNKDIILQTCKGLTTTSYALAFETLVFSDNAPFGILEEE